MKFDVEIIKDIDMNLVEWRWSVYVQGTEYGKVGVAPTKWIAKRQVKRAIKSLESMFAPYKETWTEER